MAMRNGWITVKGIVATVAVIVLAALIIGGLYVVRERSEQLRREEAIKVAQEQLETQTSDPVSVNVEENGASIKEEATAGSGDFVGDKLPETGVSDLGALIAMVLLTATVTSFWQSRRQVRALTL